MQGPRKKAFTCGPVPDLPIRVRRWGCGLVSSCCSWRENFSEELLDDKGPREKVGINQSSGGTETGIPAHNRGALHSSLGGGAGGREWLSPASGVGSRAGLA